MMAPPGVAGTLVSGTYAANLLRREATPHEQRGISALAQWWRVVQARCGPASSPRALADVAAAPLALALGYTLRRATAVSEAHWIAALEAAGVAVPIVITTWGGSLDRAWRASVRHSLSMHARWCFLFSGTRLRLLDAGRTFARRHIDFDLESLADPRQRPASSSSSPRPAACAHPRPIAAILIGWQPSWPPPTPTASACASRCAGAYTRLSSTCSPRSSRAGAEGEPGPRHLSNCCTSRH
jgi:hypothetical protein